MKTHFLGTFWFCSIFTLVGLWSRPLYDHNPTVADGRFDPGCLLDHHLFLIIPSAIFVLNFINFDKFMHAEISQSAYICFFHAPLSYQKAKKFREWCWCLIYLLGTSRTYRLSKVSLNHCDNPREKCMF